MVVDLVADGPHAVVAGVTGAGKSELLITWILAMCATRSADEVAFLLADFKGGTAFDGLAGIPHITGVITDLAGNLSEWALDAHQPLDGPCWVGENVLTDPVCAEDSPQRTARGGNWGLAEVFLRATFRFGQPRDVPSADTGFRCARYAQPAP